jgi:hypothetical protein
VSRQRLACCCHYLAPDAECGAVSSAPPCERPEQIGEYGGLDCDRDGSASQESSRRVLKRFAFARWVRDAESSLDHETRRTEGAPEPVVDGKQPSPAPSQPEQPSGSSRADPPRQGVADLRRQQLGRLATGLSIVRQRRLHATLCGANEQWFAEQLASAIREYGSLDYLVEQAAFVLASAAADRSRSDLDEKVDSLLASRSPSSLIPLYLIDCTDGEDLAGGFRSQLQRIMAVMEALPSHRLALCSLRSQLLLDVPLSDPSLLDHLPPPRHSGEVVLHGLIRSLEQLLSNDEAHIRADKYNWGPPVVAVFWGNGCGVRRPISDLLEETQTLFRAQPGAMCLHYIVPSSVNLDVRDVLAGASLGCPRSAWHVLSATQGAADPVGHLLATLRLRGVGVLTVASPEAWSLERMDVPQIAGAGGQTEDIDELPMPVATRSMESQAHTQDTFSATLSGAIRVMGSSVVLTGAPHEVRDAAHKALVRIVPDPVRGQFALEVLDDVSAMALDHRAALSNLGFRTRFDVWQRYCLRGDLDATVAAVLTNAWGVTDSTELEVVALIT